MDGLEIEGLWPHPSRWTRYLIGEGGLDMDVGSMEITTNRWSTDVEM